MSIRSEQENKKLLNKIISMQAANEILQRQLSDVRRELESGMSIPINTSRGKKLSEEELMKIQTKARKKLYK